MARVTDTEVREINPVTGDIVPFIDVANRYVTATLGSSTLIASTLKDIELYLSAHLVEVTKKGTGITEEKIGASAIKFAASSLGKNWESTKYGIVAVSLDTTGKLLSASKAPARLRTVGIAT